jgi:lincosamide nucleotidyltransferase A/C/D/E
MSATQAADLYALLSGAGIRCWVVGGWGVDALLRRVTREHKDLDVLVLLADVSLLHEVLGAHGFVRAYEWSENRPTEVSGELWDTAFVAKHPDERELDVHLISLVEGVPQLEYDGSLALPPGCLDGSGTIAGRELRCASAGAQIAMHTGYDLPDTHRSDLALLAEITPRAWGPVGSGRPN